MKLPRNFFSTLFLIVVSVLILLLPPSVRKDLNELLSTEQIADIGEKQDVLSGTSTSGIVRRVVDGDTIVVSLNGKDATVRLLGVNTPESVDPRKPVECFGKEAKEYLASFLQEKPVRLEADESQQDRDRYNRLLRYVFLEDSTNVSEKLIREGYGYEYTYDLPYKYQSDFKNAQEDAEEKKRGLWSNETCSRVK